MLTLLKRALLVLLTILSLDLNAQIDYGKQFANGKSLFLGGKYNLAMETFKPLLTYDKNNPYVEYASFYYALAAYHQNYKAVAKDMLNQIKATYPNWDKLSEVNFWLGKIQFENHDYFQGFKTFDLIKDKAFEKDIDAVKTSALSTVSDVETMRMMHEEYPKDALVAKALATLLAKNTADPDNKKLLEELIDKFKLSRAAFLPEAPKTFYKDRYAVSVLLPFMLSSLEPTTGRKRSQIVLDFYEGMKMAVDTLAAQKIDISLRIYDTERSVDKIKKYLETEELKASDLIVGPLYPEENKIVQDFSIENQINVIHPFSNSSETIGMNPYGFLFQPSAETLGRKSADYLSEHLRKKDCMIFYGPTRKDSTLAASFAAEAKEKGITLLSSEKVTSRDAAKIQGILTTATEYDEFKYPKEFTLKKDSLHSVYVATDDPLIYAKIVGAIETRNDSTVIMGSENWLDDNTIEFEKFQTLGVVMSAPNFRDTQNAHYRMFESRYLHKHRRQASNMARMGYEMMMFLGNQLKKNGVYFQDGLSASVVPGYIGQGFDYRNSRDNEIVPFIAFKAGEQKLLEKR